MIAMRDVVFGLLNSPRSWMSDVVVAGSDRDGGNSNLGEREVIRAVEVALLWVRIGRESDSFALYQLGNRRSERALVVAHDVEIAKAADQGHDIEVERGDDLR